jgi:hypothetical protein
VVQEQASGTEQPAQRPRVDAEVCGPDVLDHPDARDLVERPVVELAVVGHADLAPFVDTGVGGALARELRLRLRQRDPDRAHPVAPRRVDDERAPAAADVEWVRRERKRSSTVRRRA